jgi:hypothetical protein
MPGEMRRLFEQKLEARLQEGDKPYISIYDAHGAPLITILMESDMAVRAFRHDMAAVTTDNNGIHPDEMRIPNKIASCIDNNLGAASRRRYVILRSAIRQLFSSRANHEHYSGLLREVGGQIEYDTRSSPVADGIFVEWVHQYVTSTLRL